MSGRACARCIALCLAARASPLIPAAAQRRASPSAIQRIEIHAKPIEAFDSARCQAARALRRAGIPRRPGADVAVQGVRRPFAPARRGRRRAFPVAAATRATGSAARIVYRGTTSDRRSPTPRWRRSSAPTASRWRRRGWYDTESLATGRRHALCRHRARQSDRALRFRQGRPARARRSRSRCRPACSALPNNKGLEASGRRAARAAARAAR